MEMGVAAVSAFLADHYDPARISPAELLGEGAWSKAFAFTLDGRRLVARFGKYREDFDADVRAMHYAGPDLPVPEVLEVGEAFDAYFAISQRFDGQFLEQLDEADFLKVLPALLRGLDHLRTVTPLPEHLESSPQMQPWLLGSLEDRHPRTAGWRETLAIDPDLERAFTTGKQYLADLIVVCPPDARHVLHRDLLNKNVLVSSEASRLEAVFDWGCCLLGDFLYEVALLVFWTPWHDNLANLDLRALIRTHYADINLPIENFDARLRCYELHIALEHLAYNAFVGGRAEGSNRLAARVWELLEA